MVKSVDVNLAQVGFSVDGYQPDQFYTLAEGFFEYYYPNDDEDYFGSVAPTFFLGGPGALVIENLRFGPKT